MTARSGAQVLALSFMESGMRLIARACAILFALALLVNLSLAQKSDKEVGPENMEKLKGQGGREEHQGADNPRQGNTSKDVVEGLPDPYGAEDFLSFTEKNERNLNDPQWQLKLDLYDPKRVVIEYPDGRREEYWYILFRVINDNTRVQETTTADALNRVGSNDKPKSIGVTKQTVGRMGVPVNTHLDIDVYTYTRNVDKDPWDESAKNLRERFKQQALEHMPTGEADRDAKGDLAADQAMGAVKRHFNPISDPFVLQQIAEREQLYEWVEDGSGNQRRLYLLHPLSDFQRQVGLKHELKAADYSGPRCLPHSISMIKGKEYVDYMRYAGIYESDKTFAGWFGAEETAPEGVRIVKDASDEMWGKLTQRRYAPGDCVNRFGMALQPNDPGYLNARVAGEGESTGYGIVTPTHPLNGKPITIPNYRQYRDGEHVLFGHDTGLKVREYPNDTYKLNGVIVGPADPRYDAAQPVSASTEQFGGAVLGKPVKMIDSKGRAIRKYLVTYQVGEKVTQAEWDVWKKRLGAGILARYTNPDSIVGRPLEAGDPLVGLPKIKMGKGVGDEAARTPEEIDRGIDTGRRGPKGEVILTSQKYTTGRHYDPKKIGPENFLRDPDGEFTTARVAPLPAGAALNPGEEYVYAPLGESEEGAIPVPAFDHYGAWADYFEASSGQRVPLTDETGAIVRDDQDQILYLKEYEYEYVYMYEFDPAWQAQDKEDEGFKGRYGEDRYQLVKEKVSMKYKDGKAVGPVRTIIYETREVQEFDGTGKGVMKKSTEEVPVGVLVPGMELKPGQTTRVEDTTGFEVKDVEVVSYVERTRNDIVKGADPSGVPGVTEGDYEQPTPAENGIRPTAKTYRRWTVPPPLVYRNPNPGPEDPEWEVLTRLADKIGPATRADGKDAPRFLTRYISEMWGVFIFKNVNRDWNYLNVMIKGLRGRVSHAGLKQDESNKTMPTYKEAGGAPIPKAFYNVRYVTEDWIYRARFERLGDGRESYRDLIRRVRTFWYLDPERPRAEIPRGSSGG
jgi:hypothetical protein